MPNWKLGRALATPHHIGANDLQGMGAFLNQGLCKAVKVTPLARQAVHAHHHVARLRITPAPISHAVLALGVGTRHEFE